MGMEVVGPQGIVRDDGDVLFLPFLQRQHRLRRGGEHVSRSSG